MPGDQDFIELINLQDAEQKAEKLYAIIAGIDERIRQVATIMMVKTGDAAAFRQQSTELTEALKQIADMQKQLIKLEEKLSAAKYQTKKLNKEKTDAELRDSIDLRNETKARTDAIKAEGDAYKQLAIVYKTAAAEAKRLKAEAAKPGATAEAKAMADAAAASAKVLNDTLKAIDKSVGDTRRNVGNYAEGFKEALDSVKGDFNDVLAKMADIEKRAQGATNVVKVNKIGFVQKWGPEGSGGATMSTQGGPTAVRPEDAAAYAQLNKEASVFNRTLNDLSQEFTTSRGATRAATEAVVNMGMELGQTDARFVKFDQKIGSSVNEINDLKAALKFQAQDGRALQSLISIATGLAGAFGAAQAAMALTGDESEETQKQMAKFQQILVLTNGLQAVNNTLQEENGAIQGVLAAKMALMNIAQKILAVNTAAAAVAIEADTIANVENAASQEGVAVAATEAGAALELEAGAATAATVATTGFGTSLLATGLGAAIVVIGAAIVWLISKIPEWIRGTKLTIEQQKALADAAKKATDVLKEQAAMVEELDGTEKRYYERQLALSQAAGENAYKQFALREKIAKEELRLAQETYDTYHQQGLSERQLAGDVDVLNMKRQEAIKLMEKYGSIANPKSDDTRQLNSAKALFDLYSTQYDVAKNSYDAIHGARIKLQEANNKQGDVEVERGKFQKAEIVQTTLEGAKARANAIIEANQIILKDEDSSQKQRIAAERNILRQQMAIIEAERQAKRASPDNTPEKVKQIELEAGAAREKARVESNQKLKDINDSYRKRELQAWYDINKAVTDTQMQAAGKVSEDVKKSLDVRLAAYDVFEQKQREQINAEAEFKKKKEGQTATELFSIEVDRQQKLAILSGESQAKQAAIILSSLEQQKDKLANKSAIDSLKGEIKALDELNEKLKSGAIGIDAYNKQKEQISNKVSRDALSQQTVALEFMSGEYKRFGLSTEAIDKQIYENKKHLSELDVQDAIKAAERKKELKQKEVELARASEELIADFVRGGYERQLNGLQSQIDNNNKLKETETARINNSTLSETEKAAALERLAITTQTRNEAIERKKRDTKIKEAQFDREKGILDVGVNTAVAIMKAVAEFPLTGGEPWAAIAAAMGAIQIAAILAKPIPKFETGTESSPEGPAIVHPGELRINPDGKMEMTPNEPSLTFLQRGTKILPRHRVNQLMMDSIFAPTGRQASDTSVADEIYGLKTAIVAGSAATVAAIRKIKQAAPIINVSGDIWVHINESCK